MVAWWEAQGGVAGVVDQACGDADESVSRVAIMALLSRTPQPSSPPPGSGVAVSWCK